MRENITCRFNLKRTRKRSSWKGPLRQRIDWAQARKQTNVDFWFILDLNGGFTCEGLLEILDQLSVVRLVSLVIYQANLHLVNDLSLLGSKLRQLVHLQTFQLNPDKPPMTYREPIDRFLLGLGYHRKLCNAHLGTETVYVLFDHNMNHPANVLIEHLHLSEHLHRSCCWRSQVFVLLVWGIQKGKTCSLKGLPMDILRSL